MKTRQLIKGLGGALVAAVLVFGSPANADTQLIHFDDAGGGDQWYSTADRNFVFDPTNFSSSTLCADSTTSGNGKCVHEGGQGMLPLMTRPTNQTLSQGSSGTNAEPDYVGDDGPGELLAFTLDSFYFLLNGSGKGGPDLPPGENYMVVCGGEDDVLPNPDIENSDDPSAVCDGQALSFTFTEGGGATYSGTDGAYAGSLPVVTFYEGPNAGDPAGALLKQTGYIATFGALFADVDWIQWTAADSAQFRLDCVVATFDGTTTEPYDSETECGLGQDVPEPGTVALLGLGLVGMGLMRRRRKV